MELPTPFSIGYFNSTIARPGVRVTEKHVIPTYQLEIVAEDGGIAYLDDEVIAVRKNLIFCAKPGQVRSTKLPFRCHYVQLYAGQGEIYTLLDRLPSHWQSTPARAQMYIKIIEQLTELSAAEDDTARLRFCALLLQFLSDLAEEHRQLQLLSCSHTDRNRAAVERAIDYMKHHLAEKCTLQTLAAHVNFSPIYFHKLFTEATGKSPYTYLLELRLTLAQRMLASTDTPLSEIAYGCGFGTQSYFQYVFSRHTGLTPAAYRRSQQKHYLV